MPKDNWQLLEIPWRRYFRAKRIAIANQISTLWQSSGRKPTSIYLSGTTVKTKSFNGAKHRNRRISLCIRKMLKIGFVAFISGISRAKKKGHFFYKACQIRSIVKINQAAVYFWLVHITTELAKTFMAFFIMSVSHVQEKSSSLVIHRVRLKLWVRRFECY